jgi:hypothetical protein
MKRMYRKEVVGRKTRMRKPDLTLKLKKQTSTSSRECTFRW